MKETNIEKIEIGGKEYSLFLNRKGIVAWEKYSVEENKKVIDAANKYSDCFENKDATDATIDESTDPLKDVDDILVDDDTVSKSVRKLYWIMLYTYHKLSFNEVNKLYDEAIEDYGEDQLILLARQMLEDANRDMNKVEERKNLKNLAALRPTKN